jgi:hypothetical protein
MIVEIITVSGFVYLAYEGFVSVQACKLLNRRAKLLQQDLDWLTATPNHEFSWGSFSNHLDIQYDQQPELFLIPYIPPTLMWKDEREKYLESKTFVHYPQHEVKIKIRERRI